MVLAVFFLIVLAINKLTSCCTVIKKSKRWYHCMPFGEHLMLVIPVQQVPKTWTKVPNKWNVSQDNEVGLSWILDVQSSSSILSSSITTTDYTTHFQTSKSCTEFPVTLGMEDTISDSFICLVAVDIQCTKANYDPIEHLLLMYFYFIIKDFSMFQVYALYWCTKIFLQKYSLLY